MPAGRLWLLATVAWPACASRAPLPVTLTGPCDPRQICVTADVRDSAGMPLPGAAVILVPTSCYALTDSAGHAPLRCDADRADGVRVRRLGYEPWAVEYTLVRGQGYALRVTMQPVPPNIRFGHVTDSSGPATVAARGLWRGACTTDGRVTITHADTAADLPPQPKTEPTMPPFPTIDPRVTIGHVHLKVADLDRALAFYHDVLGFAITQRMGGQAAFLSAGGYHHHLGLNTWESRGGSPPPRGATGLYHIAIRYPERRVLADAYRRVTAAGIALRGASDHGVSEALYLDDPDGNGVELYWDRPRAAWPRAADGTLAMVTQPLDLRSLLAEPGASAPTVRD